MDFDFENVHVATNFYQDRHFNTQAVKILPGEYYATTNEYLIVTVLGSCISVCLYDPVSKIGGMNHFLLPNDNDDHSVISASARYGSYAMEILINHLIKLGAHRERLVAKVFGGANVLPSVSSSSVGEKNTSFVKDYLDMEHIKIVAMDVLNTYPRKVYFFPHTGKVMLKKMKVASIEENTVIEREIVYRSKMAKKPKTGDVDLF